MESRYRIVCSLPGFSLGPGSGLPYSACCMEHLPASRDAQLFEVMWWPWPEAMNATSPPFDDSITIIIRERGSHVTSM